MNSDWICPKWFVYTLIFFAGGPIGPVLVSLVDGNLDMGRLAWGYVGSFVGVWIGGIVPMFWRRISS